MALVIHILGYVVDPLWVVESWTRAVYSTQYMFAHNGGHAQNF
jgi:hypothetical protein